MTPRRLQAMKLATRLDAISNHIELGRMDAATIQRAIDEVNKSPLDHLDNVSSYGFIPAEFDHEFEEQVIDYTVRGVH
jgi:hypothetical protein